MAYVTTSTTSNMALNAHEAAQRFKEGLMDTLMPMYQQPNQKITAAEFQRLDHTTREIANRVKNVVFTETKLVEPMKLRYGILITFDDGHVIFNAVEGTEKEMLQRRVMDDLDHASISYPAQQRDWFRSLFKMLVRLNQDEAVKLVLMYAGRTYEHDQEGGSSP
jgi:hypothetical protein